MSDQVRGKLSDRFELDRAMIRAVAVQEGGRAGEDAKRCENEDGHHGGGPFSTGKWFSIGFKVAAEFFVSLRLPIRLTATSVSRLTPKFASKTFVGFLQLIGELSYSK